MPELGSSDVLHDLVQRRKAGQRVGIASICSSNAFVLEAAIQQAVRLGTPLLIEATCNQVNQFGGYSGLRPVDFAETIRAAGEQAGLPLGRIVLGGDHLGPFPWRAEPFDDAMRKARDMVIAYAQAGFSKLHLDASMPCADDDERAGLDPKVIAERTALLCEAAEGALPAQPRISRPAYVVGTEVPAPGGPAAGAAVQLVTDAGEAARNLRTFHASFQQHGLTDAWSRVIAMVVNPGVEFGDQLIRRYDPAVAADLARFIAGVPGMVFEAHSTDYQTAASLKAMVDDQFAILKLGPALTFAFREAVFALAHIEAEWLADRASVKLSGLIDTVEAAMLADPASWTAYYRKTESELALARKYSRLDRIRYYWNVPDVARALEQLLANLEQYPPLPTLVSQYFPARRRDNAAGSPANQPRELIRNHILETLRDYAWACGQLNDGQP